MNRRDVNGLVECDECGLGVEDENVYSAKELSDPVVPVLCEGCARLYGTEG